jgi:hypothetical protein
MGLLNHEISQITNAPKGAIVQPDFSLSIN